MSRSIELPDEVYGALQAAASAAGVTPAELLDQLLASLCSNGGVPAEGVSSEADSHVDADDDAAAGTLYDRMKHLIGVVSFDAPDICMTTPAGPAAAVDVRAVPEAAPAKRMTLAERIATDPDPFYSGRGDLAERHSESFAEGMVEKRRKGTL